MDRAREVLPFEQVHRPACESALERTGLVGTLSFEELPGVQQVQLLRDEVAGTFRFVLNFVFVQEKGVHLAFVESVGTAQFVPSKATLRNGDVLLSANGQLIAGRPKKDVLQILQGLTGRLVELMIIRSHCNIFSDDACSELHQLCDQMQEQHPLASAKSEELPPLSTDPHVVCVNEDIASGNDKDNDPDFEAPPPPSHPESGGAFWLTAEELSRFDALSLASLRMEHSIELGKWLDPYFDQWRMIADRGGISRRDILLIETRCGDRRFTEAVLRELEQRQSMSVGKLFRTLLEFDRFDIMEYAKEKIVPELLSMEQREVKKSQCQQRSSPQVFFPVQDALMQAPTAQPHPRRFGSADACQICFEQHSKYVYVSYAQDMKKDVRQVVTWLRQCGKAVHYDQMDEHGRAAKSAPQWKFEQLDGAEFVLALFSPGYIQQLNDDDADNRQSPGCQPGCGVSFDINHILQDIYQKNGNYRCIPVLLNGFKSDCIPNYLRNTYVYRFPDQEESIWRRLTRTREYELPPLGERQIPKPKREYLTLTNK